MAAAPFDVAIAGAGIAGSALAFELAGDLTVLLLEREDQPGYHSTGRSAAMLTETYGTPAVRALAKASRSFFERPPAGFTELPLLQPRGMLHVARPDQLPSLEAAERSARPLLPGVRILSAAEVVARAPLVDRRYAAGGLLEPDAMAIDVAALHQGYLGGVRRRGGRLVCGAGIRAIERTGSGFALRTAAGRFETAVLVNAAGAWADELARLAEARPIGLVPKRRTALLIEPPDGLDPARWPMVIDVDEQFYVKPEGGQLLLSPADETPVEPSDVQPEEFDIAVAVERYQQQWSQRGADRTALGRAPLVRRRPRAGHRSGPGRSRLHLARCTGRLRHHDRTGGGTAGRGRRARSGRGYGTQVALRDDEPGAP